MENIIEKLNRLGLGKTSIGEIIDEIDQLRARNAELEAVLKTISEWGCNGQCVELCGNKCPCCIAMDALRRR